MSVTPDYFLLLILGGGLIVIFTGLTVYLSGCAEWVKEMLTPKIPPENPDPDVEDCKTDTPRYMRRSVRSSIAVLPRPIGTGYYTSSPFWSAPPPIGLPGDVFSFEQAFPPPEWMSGYLFGLQASLADPQGGEQSSHPFYSGNPHDPNDLQIPPQYSHAQLNTGNPEFMVHLPGNLDCDEDHCATEHDNHIGMNFGDGGAAAAAF